MQRSIKFRGKAIEDYETSTDGVEIGDWVEGHYYYCPEHAGPVIYTTLGAESGGLGPGFIYAPIGVDPDTVGQFIGLKDKNGVGDNVYEGDIFNCIYHSDGCVNHVFVVSYSNEAAMFYLSRRGNSCQQTEVRQRIPDVARYCSIGNVTDNPELLK